MPSVVKGSVTSIAISEPGPKRVAASAAASMANQHGPGFGNFSLSQPDFAERLSGRRLLEFTDRVRANEMQKQLFSLLLYHCV
jgi:hypothetical protein